MNTEKSYELLQNIANSRVYFEQGLEAGAYKKPADLRGSIEDGLERLKKLEITCGWLYWSRSKNINEHIDVLMDKLQTDYQGVCEDLDDARRRHGIELSDDTDKYYD